MDLIDTWVTVDEQHIYPARLDPSGPRVSPGLTLEAVRQLAAHNAEDAEQFGHEGDQIRVIDGAPEPVVLHIRWSDFTTNRLADTVNVVKPDAEGLYWIGDSEWTWSQIADGPLFYTQNEAFAAWQRVLTETGFRMGEIVRTQMPQATACLVDLSGLGHIARIEAHGHAGWPTGTNADGESGYGPFDTETLGEADEVLRQALDQGREAIDLEIGGWRPARDINRPELHRIRFAPLGAGTTGEGPLEEARAQAAEVRRKLLAETAPYLARDIRAACPAARGVAVAPSPERPLLLFIVDGRKDTGDVGAPVDVMHKLRDRLSRMFAFEPSHDDLIACGWVRTPQGLYVLTFPAT